MMAKEKTKRNLFARIPRWVKAGLGVYLVGIPLMLGIHGFAFGVWNPLKYDESRKMRTEQFELKKKRLGPLAGPIKINIPSKFKEVPTGGMYGVTYVERRPDHEATKRERVRVEKLGEKIFGENGYADVNGNKIIDLNELTDVYIRMGLDSKVVQTGRFPDVRAEHLEQAVKSYEGEN